jgi:hypothetical protein
MNNVGQFRGNTGMRAKPAVHNIGNPHPESILHEAFRQDISNEHVTEFIVNAPQIFASLNVLLDLIFTWQSMPGVAPPRLLECISQIVVAPEQDCIGGKEQIKASEFIIKRDVFFDGVAQITKNAMLGSRFVGEEGSCLANIAMYVTYYYCQFSASNFIDEITSQNSR